MRSQLRAAAAPCRRLRAATLSHMRWPASRSPILPAVLLPRLPATMGLLRPSVVASPSRSLVAVPHRRRLPLLPLRGAPIRVATRPPLRFRAGSRPRPWPRFPLLIPLRWLGRWQRRSRPTRRPGAAVPWPLWPALPDDRQHSRWSALAARIRRRFLRSRSGTPHRNGRRDRRGFRRRLGRESAARAAPLVSRVRRQQQAQPVAVARS